MAHDWKDIVLHFGSKSPYWDFGWSSYGIRECRKCKALQKKESKTEWMRITGYYWTPKVGRCPADRKDWDGTLHKTAIRGDS